MNFTPGVHRSVSFKDYLDIPAVSASMLKDVDEECAAYALWKREHREPDDYGWTTQKRGSALHARLLEPERYKQEYVHVLGCEAVLASGARKGQQCGKATGALYDGEFLCGSHAPETIADKRICVSPEGTTELDKMEAAVRNVASPVLDSATHKELTLCWYDQEFSLPMKARLDLVSASTVYDLKCLADIAPQRWGSLLLNNGMFYQAVHYLRGAQECGLQVNSFAWIAVRNSEPYIATIHPPLDDASFDAAESLWRDRLRMLKECESAKVWPGYDVPERSSLPGWFVSQFAVAP